MKVPPSFFTFSLYSLCFDISNLNKLYLIAMNFSNKSSNKKEKSLITKIKKKLLLKSTMIYECVHNIYFYMKPLSLLIFLL